PESSRSFLLVRVGIVERTPSSLSTRGKLCRRGNVPEWKGSRVFSNQASRVTIGACFKHPTRRSLSLRGPTSGAGEGSLASGRLTDGTTCTSSGKRGRENPHS